MNFKESIYFHPRERKSILYFLAIVLTYTLSEDVLISKIVEARGNTDIELVSLYVEEPQYLSGCYEANDLELDQLQEMGLDSAVAVRWINFRNSIGGFDSFQQVGRIFGLTEETLKQLRPVLNFEQKLIEGEKPERQTSRNRKTNQFRQTNEFNNPQPADSAKPTPTIATRKLDKKPELSPFCINTSDEQTFMQIKGIGPVLSERIVSYRGRLGGFTDNLQLMEVFGLDSAIVLENIELFLIEDVTISKINWREAEFRDVLSHPYLEYEEVQCIFNVRNKSSGAPDCISGCFLEEKWHRVNRYLGANEPYISKENSNGNSAIHEK